jgi:hypothetical protein
VIYTPKILFSFGSDDEPLDFGIPDFQTDPNVTSLSSPPLRAQSGWAPRTATPHARLSLYLEPLDRVLQAIVNTALVKQLGLRKNHRKAWNFEAGSNNGYGYPPGKINMETSIRKSIGFPGKIVHEWWTVHIYN